MYDINLLDYHYDHEDIVEVLYMIDMVIMMFQLFDNVFLYLNLILNVVMVQFYFHYDLIVYDHSKIEKERNKINYYMKRIHIPPQTSYCCKTVDKCNNLFQYFFTTKPTLKLEY